MNPRQPKRLSRHALSPAFSPYPPGTRLIGWRQEIDDNEGLERVTPAGSIWTVGLEYDNDRHIFCKASGATIIPTVEECRTLFSLSLLGWYCEAEEGGEYTAIASKSLLHPIVTVRGPNGDWMHCNRDLFLLHASPAGMTYCPERRGFFPRIRIATWNSPTLHP